MKLLKNKHIGYILFTLFITAFFLYLKFPGDSVSRYTELRVNSGRDFNITIEDSTPLLPPGIHYTNVCVNFLNNRITCLPNIRVYPFLYPVFGNISAEGSIFGGYFESDISDSGKQIYADIKEVKINRIDLTKFKMNPYDVRFSGSLSSNINISKVKKYLQGKIVSQIDNFRVSSKIFPVKNLNFKSVKLSILINHKVITIKDLIFSGSELSGNINGTVFLDKNLVMSRLNLTCNVNPSPGFVKTIKSKIPLKMLMGNSDKIMFKIKGTVKKPLWRLN